MSRCSKCGVDGCYCDACHQILTDWQAENDKLKALVTLYIDLAANHSRELSVLQAKYEIAVEGLRKIMNESMVLNGERVPPSIEGSIAYETLGKLDAFGGVK